MKNKNWYAWNNLMPPKPDVFHLIGAVLVANPGVEAVLSYREPQGVNPAILILDLHLVQKPGIWPQVMTWADVRYDKVYCPDEPLYSQVEVYEAGKLLVRLDVDTVS